MLRYYISDGTASTTRGAGERIQRAIDRGVDLVQIREKDLTDRALLQFMASIERKQARMLVNGRFDVALAAGADGVHLPANSPPPSRFRSLVPSTFLIAVSCHSVADVLAAEQDGADLVVLGPIFPTPSKLAYGEPLGLRLLHQAVHVTQLPVFALGGVNPRNLESCRRAGVAGVAGIRMFGDAEAEPFAGQDGGG